MILIINFRNDCTMAQSSSWLLMRLKVVIFRGNALIYIKRLHIFHWPTFSLSPHSLPQVHVSRAEELCRPLPTHASQASGTIGLIQKEQTDQGVEELQRWRAVETLQAVYSTLTHPGDPLGHFPPVSHSL